MVTVLTRGSHAVSLLANRLRAVPWRTAKPKHGGSSLYALVWLELLVHYVVAAFIWTRDEVDDKSALGRVTRVVVVVAVVVTATWFVLR